MGGELTQHLAEHRARPYVAEGYVLESWVDPMMGSVLGFHAHGDSAAAAQPKRAYIDFEAAFRGPEERVREIQRAYLPLLAGQAPVLDIGCGRGELLDLLTEAGVQASGVDVDAGMVEHARAKGHDVALGDAVAHLRTLAPGQLGAVVSLEVIEHLPYAELLELLTLARSRLREDGVLLLETVNPHAVDAMKAFWLDPTHQHPLFPEVTLELCRLTGFAEALWFHPIGSGDFESDRNRAPIYAILARSRSEPAGDWRHAVVHRGGDLRGGAVAQALEPAGLLLGAAGLTAQLRQLRGRPLGLAQAIFAQGVPALPPHPAPAHAGPRASRYPPSADRP